GIRDPLVTGVQTCALPICRGETFFVRKRSEGGSSYGDAQQIVLVTGSHTLQVPWLETGQGRTLEQFPFAYIVAEKMWAPVSETRSEERRVGKGCRGGE